MVSDDKEKTLDEIVTRFFELRFPDKSIPFEKKCGYFGEWRTRFASGQPETWMDGESRAAYEQMKREGYGVSIPAFLRG